MNEQRSNLIVIAARSASFLARAARAANYRPIVLDAYGDSDTCAAAERYFRLVYDSDGRINFDKCLAIFASIRNEYGALPIVWGSGWEADGHLLQALAQTWSVRGSAPNALLRLADPNRLPNIVKKFSNFIAPSYFERGKIRDKSVLIKRNQRSGGHDVRNALNQRHLSLGEFFQPHYEGQSMSVCAVADRGHSTIIGWAEHFALQPSLHYPFRQGAAVVSRQRTPPATEVAQLLDSIVKELDMVGLFGCDFVQRRCEEMLLVDVNPRPTASAALHLSPANAFQLHLEPERLAELSLESRISANAVIYADRPIRILKTIDWPPWVTDRPEKNRIFHNGEPICTINSAGTTQEQARQQLRERYRMLMHGVFGIETGSN